MVLYEPALCYPWPLHGSRVHFHGSNLEVAEILCRI